MLSNLSTGAVWLLNIGGLSLLPLAVSYYANRLPAHWFNHDRGLLRLWRFERGGGWYERQLAIAGWKDKLPDGGAWMKGGFAKKRLQRRTPEYLQQFIRETRRGEWVHWVQLLLAPIFLLWNEGWGSALVMLYCLGANLPCIAVQRYNRARLLQLMFRKRQICYARMITNVALED
jgi:glycosyl-4,4'-diaponeurosporenoate acyltransferase